MEKEEDDGGMEISSPACGRGQASLGPFVARRFPLGANRLSTDSIFCTNWLFGFACRELKICL